MVITIVFLVFFVNLSFFVYKFFVYKSKKIKDYVGKGKWAIVTGCTSGIGEGFCYELAERGNNLVLVSRSESKLKAMQETFSKKYPKISTEIVVVDFNKNDLSSEMGVLQSFMSKHKIHILVNNVGINTDMPKEFIDHSDEELKMLMNVNLWSGIKMTQTVLPAMKAQREGLIINLSSYSSVVPIPLLPVYSGNKAHISQWSRCLRREVKEYNVDVLSIIPMYVMSKMTGAKKESWKTISGQKLAKLTFDRVGCPLDGSTISPYWVHAVITKVFSMIPEFIMDGLSYGQMMGTRNYYLQKKKQNL